MDQPLRLAIWRLSAAAAGLAVAAVLTAGVADTAQARPKKTPHITVKKKPRGVGFLPGYRTPEQIARTESRPQYWYNGRWYYFGRPGYHRGRWTGGSFGPCWKSTPIGLMWVCGQ